jgi:alkylhydroperoxidase family enzyme
MLDYAIKLTHTPWAMRREDVETLRQAGFDDVAIHDIAQLAGLFAYYNRIADGLGIDLEPGLSTTGAKLK